MCFGSWFITFGFDIFSNRNFRIAYAYQILSINIIKIFLEANFSLTSFNKEWNSDFTSIQISEIYRLIFLLRDYCNFLTKRHIFSLNISKIMPYSPYRWNNYKNLAFNQYRCNVCLKFLCFLSKVKYLFPTPNEANFYGCLITSSPRLNLWSHSITKNSTHS